MGQVLHGCATTTETIRRAIQHSQESLRTLAKRYGINPKTVAKWRQRCSAADLPTGPKEPKSTVLSIEDEAIIVAFRRHTLLPLDDCLYALQPSIPHLTRSSLHRCLQRHGISQLPDVEGNKPAKKKFKTYPIGFFHIDIAEVRTEEGKLHLFVAIDRTSKFAFVELHEKATTKVAAEFLRHLIAAVPYKIHTVLTDNGIHFTIPGGGGATVGEIKEAIAALGAIARTSGTTPNSFPRKGRRNALELHPTVKPIAMVSDAILDSTKRNDIVLDPYCGSGTTLLAAERTGRRGYGIEIDPLYVDTAITRWERITGNHARHATGRTFADIKAERKITP